MKEKSLKKVGILTFHYSNNNFGAVLQTYSIYNLIKSFGLEPNIINFKPEKKDFKAKLLDTIQALTGFQFESFRKKYIPNILERMNNRSDLNILNHKIDIFVVGSDQVWRYRNDHESLKKYFFDFVDNDKPKIAVSASFGLEEWSAPKSITEDLKALAQRFTAVSVREESGIAICEKYFEVPSVKSLDPTMLLDQQHFHDLADKSELKLEDKKYLAYMLLDASAETENYLKSVASKNDLEFIKIKGTKLVTKPDIWLFNSIPNWLEYLRKSDFIVTDSFHCVVFSLIFRKKFICIANETRGVTRLKNLLGLIGLKDRFFTSLDKHGIENKVSESIDFDAVWKILDVEKKDSIQFLRSNLHS